MKHKKRIYIFTFILLMIEVIYISYSISLYNTRKILHMVKNNVEYTFTHEEIVIKERKLEKELENSKFNKQKAKVYCALGYVQLFKLDFKKANEYFLNAKKYSNNNENIDSIMIYNGLATVENILNDEEGYKRSIEAIDKLECKYSYSSYLASTYAMRSKEVLYSEYGTIKDSIMLVDKAISIEKNKKNLIELYIYSSKLYMLNNSFEVAYEYTIKALSLAYHIDDYNLINKACINLGASYLLREMNDKALNVLSDIYINRKMEIEDEIEVILYLIDIYTKMNDYENVNKYLEILFDMNDKLGEKQYSIINKVYYTCLACKMIKENNLEEAKVFLNKSDEIVNGEINYTNRFIWLYNEKMRIDIISKESNIYTEVKNLYMNLLEKINQKGIKCGIRNDVLNSMINFAYERKQISDEKIYHNLKYNLTNSDSLSFELELSDLLKRVEENLIIKNKQDKKRNLVFYLSIIIILFAVLAIIYIQNKNIKKLNKELTILNVRDPLTNAYNKRYMEADFQKACINNEKITLIMLDIDYFKLYNDNYGHMKGDNTLKEVAKIIMEVFKDDDVIRYGGEEFCIISRKDVDIIIRRVNSLINNLNNRNIVHEYSEISDRVTLSIGIASRQIVDKGDCYRLINKADENLYKSKKKGRNTYTI